MLTFDSKSLHYKLALLGGLSEYDDDSNICEYTRHVMFGMVIALLIGLLIAFMGTILANMVFAVGFSLVYGMLIYSEAASAGFFVSTIGTIWFGIWKLSESAKEHRNKTRNEPKKPDGFVKHAYKSWKEKYCVKIEFANKSEDSGWDGS